MTSQVGEYINTYGYTAFRKLSGRAQCALMYNAFKAKTSNEKASLRVQKTKFYAAMEEQIVNIVNKTLPPKPLPQTKTPITPPNDALPHSQGGGLQIEFDTLDLSSLDANQQSLFKIAWHQYINNPTPQWFNVLMTYLKDTQQLQTQESDEWKQLKQLDNSKLISLIKPVRSSPPAMTPPLLKNTATL